MLSLRNSWETPDTPKVEWNPDDIMLRIGNERSVAGGIAT
jgi:hypothetical protein